MTSGIPTSSNSQQQRRQQTITRQRDTHFAPRPPARRRASYRNESLRQTHEHTHTNTHTSLKERIAGFGALASSYQIAAGKRRLPGETLTARQSQMLITTARILVSPQSDAVCINQVSQFKAGSPTKRIPSRQLFLTHTHPFFPPGFSASPAPPPLDSRSLRPHSRMPGPVQPRRSPERPAPSETPVPSTPLRRCIYMWVKY